MEPDARALSDRQENAGRTCLSDHWVMTKTGLYRFTILEESRSGVMGDVFIHAEDLANLAE